MDRARLASWMGCATTLGRSWRVPALIVVLSGCGAEGLPPGDGPFVFDDLRHSWKQNRVDYRLGPGVFSYQGVFGYARLFDRLELAGVEVASRDEELSDESLSGFHALFINLVSDDRPSFSSSEIDAVSSFVHAGGGLIVIADHTNVYGHADRINPVLEPMGINVTPHTVVEPAPGRTVEGLGWLLVSDVTPHPVTEGVSFVSLQTGGPIVGGTSLARTSSISYADLWNPNDEGGFYGNWAHDGNEATEPHGPLSVVAATEFGEGRVVVFGDQNMFGDAWLHYGDNDRLAWNAFDWVLRKDTPTRSTKSPLTQIGIDEVSSLRSCGRGEASAFYGLFVALNRNPNLEAHARFTPDDDDSVWVVVGRPNARRFDGEGVASVRSHLEQSGTLMVLGESDSTRDLLLQLDPTFSPGVSLGPVGAGILSSTALSLDRSEVRYEPMRSNWGESFIEGPAGTVARMQAVAGGRVIVFPSGRLFSNELLGLPTTEPTPEQLGNHELVRALAAFLSTTK